MSQHKNYPQITSALRNYNPAYKKISDSEISDQLDAIFQCGYEWIESENSFGFYHPNSKMYLKIAGLQYYSPEAIIKAYNEVWSKDTKETREKFKMLPETQLGCLFFVSFSLFFFINKIYTIAIIIILFIAFTYASMVNKKTRKAREEWDKGLKDN